MNPLITKLALSLIGGILCLQVSAQSPPLINYQAIARNAATGAELTNQSLYLVLKVRSGSPGGNIVYQEEHLSAATNEFGLFNIQIGAGAALNGNFSSINWSMGPYWLEIDMDAGSGLETLGSMQFVSVPYALHAGSADNVDDADPDPLNELITEISLEENQILSVLEGANAHTVDLSGLVNLDDVDPTNELISDVTLVNGNTLTINEGPNTHELDLSGLVNVDDIDPANELISDVTLVNGNTLTINEGPNTHELDLSGLVNVDDIDPANELISNVTLVNGNTLTINEGPNTHELDLSSLVNVDDIDPSNELISDVTLVNGNTLTINEGPNTHELDLSGLVNVDDIDPANELISDVTLVNGNTLTINEGPNTHELDLSGLVNVDDVDPANELISDVTLVNGNTLTINEGPNTHELDLSGLVNVEDIDPTNELQTLSEVIAYSNPQGSAGAQRITDLSNPLDAQDAATKSYVDDFDLTGDLDQTLDNPRVVGLQNRPVAATAPVDGQVLVYNQVAGAWQPHTLPPSPLSGDQYYSFDISAFEETKKDGDADKTNMVTFDGAPEYLTIHKGDLGNVFIAPIHLQNGAKITEIKYSYKKRQWGHNLRFRLMRYEPATGAFAIISSWTTNFLPTSENIQTYTQDVTLNPEGLRTVDNSKYTYRLELLFNIGSASYDDMSDVQLMFYGAIMKYSL